QNDFERLIEALTALLHCDLKASKLMPQESTADAEVQPPPTEQIHHSVVLGHTQRVMKRQERDPGPEADTRSALGGRGHDHWWRGTHSISIMKVVLGEPRRLKSQRLGVGDLIQQFSVKIDVRSFGLVVVADEKETKLHTGSL